MKKVRSIKVRRSHISPGTLLDEYRVCLGVLNRSPKTISWYLEILKRYFAFLEMGKLLRPINEISKKELSAYVVHLQSSTRWADKRGTDGDKGKLSAYSVQGHVRALRAFWSWLLREGYIKENPLADFPLPKVPKNMIRTISMDEFRIVLDSIDRSTAWGVRNYVMMLTMLDTGVRVSELVGMRREDIDLKLAVIKVRGKGDKERIVPISPPTKREIAKYLSKFHRELCSVESAYLFPNHKGGPVTVNCVQQMMRRLRKKAGLVLKLYPHLLRHTTATEFSRRGGSAFVLKEFMGHESLATTLKYVHLGPDDLKREHSRYSPVLGLKLDTK